MKVRSTAFRRNCGGGGVFFTSAFRLKAVLQTLTWVLKRPLRAPNFNLLLDLPKDRFILDHMIFGQHKCLR